MCMNLINWVFVQPSDIESYFLVVVILYCANIPALLVPDCKFSEGVVWLNWVAKWVAAWKRSKNTGLGLILKVIGWLMVRFCQQKVFVKSICLVWQVCGTALCSGAVRDFVRGWPVTSVVRVHFLVILHKDYFDVTAQFLVYYNRIWRQISFSNFFRGGHGVFGLILAALLPLWTLS